MKHPFSRRDFFKNAMISAGAAALGAHAAEKPIAGFEETNAGKVKNTAWKPVSDRKVKVGIAGYGQRHWQAQETREPR